MISLAKEYNVGTVYTVMEARANRFTAVLNGMMRNVDDFKIRMLALGGVGAGMAVGLGYLVTSGIKINATLERLRMSYQVLFKDQQKANDAYGFLLKLADKSPFQTTQILEAGRAMVAFGLDVKAYMKDAMDMSSAMGADLMEVVGALGRIKSGAFGEAFERLRYLGISHDMLKEFGVEFGPNGRYEGTVDAMLEAVVNVIRNRFGEMSKVQAQTWDGLMSTLTSKIKLMNAELTQSIFEAAKGPLRAAIKAFDEMDGVTKRVIAGLITFTGLFGAVMAIGSAIIVFQAKVTAALTAMKGAMLTLFTNPYFLIAAAIVAITVGYGTYKAIQNNLEQDQENLAEKMVEQARKARDSANEHKKLAEAYRENARELASSTPGTEKYNRALSQSRDLTKKLGELYPEIVTQRDKDGKVLAISLDLLNKTIEAENKLAEIRTRAARKKLEENIAVAQAGIPSASGNVDRLKKAYEDWDKLSKAEKEWFTNVYAGGDSKNARDKVYQSLLQWANILDGLRQQISTSQEQLDKLYKPVETVTTTPSLGNNAKQPPTKEQIEDAINQIIQSYLKAIDRMKEAEKLEIQNRYAELVKDGKVTWDKLIEIEIDGQKKKVSVREAMNAELSAVDKKYAEQAAQINEQVQQQINQSTAKTFAEKLMLATDNYNANIKKGVSEELARKLFEIEYQALIEEQKRAEATFFENLKQSLAKVREDSLQEALSGIDTEEKKLLDEAASLYGEGTEQYEAQRTVIVDSAEAQRASIRKKYALEAIKAEKELGLQRLEINYKSGLISEKEYQEAKIAVLESYFDRVKTLMGEFNEETSSAELDLVEARIDYNESEVGRIIQNLNLRKQATQQEIDMAKRMLDVEILIWSTRLGASSQYVKNLIEARTRLDSMGSATDTQPNGNTGTSPEESINNDLKQLYTSILPEAINAFIKTLMATGDPVAALVSLLVSLLTQTQSLKRIAELLNRIVNPFVQFIDSILKPILDLLEPVINFLADSLISLLNGIIAVYNFLLGWLLGKAEYISTSPTTPEEDEDKGNWVGEITGPTRDLLIMLMKPLDILPNFMSGVFDRMDYLASLIASLPKGENPSNSGNSTPQLYVDKMYNNLPSVKSGLSFPTDLKKALDGRGLGLA